MNNFVRKLIKFFIFLSRLFLIELCSKYFNVRSNIDSLSLLFQLDMLDLLENVASFKWGLSLLIVGWPRFKSRFSKTSAICFWPAHVIFLPKAGAEYWLHIRLQFRIQRLIPRRMVCVNIGYNFEKSETVATSEIYLFDPNLTQNKFLMITIYESHLR